MQMSDKGRERGRMRGGNQSKQWTASLASQESGVESASARAVCVPLFACGTLSLCLLAGRITRLDDEERDEGRKEGRKQDAASVYSVCCFAFHLRYSQSLPFASQTLTEAARERLLQPVCPTPSPQSSPLFSPFLSLSLSLFPHSDTSRYMAYPAFQCQSHREREGGREIRSRVPTSACAHVPRLCMRVYVCV